MDQENNKKSEILNNSTNIKESSDSNEIDYKELFQGVIRKKKWAISAGAISFLAVLGYTLNQRITNPIYSGTFRLLIKDPISNSSRSTGDLNVNSTAFYQELAANNQKYDIDSLISLLGSPTFLEPLAKKYDVSPIKLADQINISVPRNTNFFRSTASVLNVEYQTKSKITGDRMIKDLSKVLKKKKISLRKENVAVALF